MSHGSTLRIPLTCIVVVLFCYKHQHVLIVKGQNKVEPEQWSLPESEIGRGEDVYATAERVALLTLGLEVGMSRISEPVAMVRNGRMSYTSVRIDLKDDEMNDLRSETVMGKYEILVIPRSDGEEYLRGRLPQLLMRRGYRGSL